MAFNAQDFRSQFGKSRPLQANHFDVQIPILPNILMDRIDQRRLINFNNLRFRVITSDMPGRQMEVQERRHSGPTRLMPMGLTYQTLTLEILEDDWMQMREIIDKWQDAIFNQGESYRVAYYDDIVVPEIIMTIYDKEGDGSRIYRFKDAFPISINPSQMSWTTTDQYVTIPVEFAYREWVGEQI